jgi:hypothetical protein
MLYASSGAAQDPQTARQTQDGKAQCALTTYPYFLYPMSPSADTWVVNVFPPESRDFFCIRRSLRSESAPAPQRLVARRG